MIPIKEAYELLEIGEDQFKDGAQPSVIYIKKAFKKMALLYHPDKNKSPDAEEKFKRILKAYETLIHSRTQGYHSNGGDDAEEEGENYERYFGYFFRRNDASENNSAHFETNFDDLLEKLFQGLDDDLADEEEDDDYLRGVTPEDETALVASRAKIWEEEDAKSDKERRKRYFCGKDYMKINTIEDWPTYLTTHKVAPLPRAEGRVACNDEIARKLAIISGSVAHIEADAILSSVNEWLYMGGGVDGYVRRNAGPKIEQELRLCGSLAVGTCVITRGYDLPAKYVIHGCGPCGPRPKQLAMCYKHALDLAVRHNIRTIGMCGISAGNNGYPLNESARVAIKTVRRWLEIGNNKTKIDKIVFACYMDYEVKVYEKWMQKYFPTSHLLEQAKREITSK